MSPRLASNDLGRKKGLVPKLWRYGADPFSAGSITFRSPEFFRLVLSAQKCIPLPEADFGHVAMLRSSAPMLALLAFRQPHDWHELLTILPLVHFLSVRNLMESNPVRKHALFLCMDMAELERILKLVSPLHAHSGPAWSFRLTRQDLVSHNVASFQPHVILHSRLGIDSGTSW